MSAVTHIRWPGIGLLGLWMLASATAAAESEPTLQLSPQPLQPGDVLQVSLPPAWNLPGRRLRLLDPWREVLIAERELGRFSDGRFSFDVPGDVRALIVTLDDGEQPLLRQAVELAAEPAPRPARHLPRCEQAPADAATLKDWLARCDLYMAALAGRDLRHADLSGRSLIGADLRGADLADANLARADLSNASLHQARLDGADLSGATLARADLSAAQLFVANLAACDLSGADLRDADLSAANLANARLIGARLAGARLADADFTGALCPDGSRAAPDCQDHLELP